MLNDQYDSWKKKFRFEGIWSNIGTGIKLLRITENGNVLTSMNNDMTVEHMPIFCIRQGKGMVIEAVNEYSVPSKW